MSNVKTARKRPVKIQVIQITDTKGNIKEIRDFCGECVFNRNAYYKDEFVIETLEGDMHCKLGDWIAKGVEGEIYPIRSSIFNASHEIIS